MKRYLPVILLILTALFWATNFHVVKIALDFYSPLGVAFWRFLFGGITLVAVLYYQRGYSLFKLRYSKRDWWYIALTSFFGIFLTIYFFNYGLKTASAINGSLIVATSPAITAILTYIFQKVRIGWLEWVAIVISFLGVGIILVEGDVSQLASFDFEIGDIYILLMALVFSLSQVIVSKYLGHVDAIILSGLISVMSLVLFFFLSLPELAHTPIPIDLSFWGSILFMGIFGTGIAYSAFYYCVVEVGAPKSALYLNLIPFFAVLLAFPFGETIHVAQIVGGGIIVLGILLFGYARREVVKMY